MYQIKSHRQGCFAAYHWRCGETRGTSSLILHAARSVMNIASSLETNHLPGAAPSSALTPIASCSASRQHRSFNADHTAILVCVPVPSANRGSESAIPAKPVSLACGPLTSPMSKMTVNCSQSSESSLCAFDRQVPLLTRGAGWRPRQWPGDGLLTGGALCFACDASF